MSLGSDTSAPLNILVVCTGNICRSPVAEQVLRARLGAAGAPVTIVSAGTNALRGQGMTPEAAALSAEYGGIPAGHAATRLSAELIATADLVLTATRAHRAEVVSLHPRAARYAFTIKQFARLLATARELDPESVAAGTPSTVVAEAAASRGYAPPLADPADDDIDDPYQQPQFVYDRVGVEIDAAVSEIVNAFASGGGRSDGEAVA